VPPTCDAFLGALPPCGFGDDTTFSDHSGRTCAQWTQSGRTCLKSQDATNIAAGYTQGELDEIRTHCPAACVTGVGVTDVVGYTLNGLTCSTLSADLNGDGIADCSKSQDYLFPVTPEADDPAFRQRGFSCAQWNVERANGVIACKPSEDAHWIANDGYTQAELDSLRTNCPATCLFDAAGAFTTQFGGVARVETCAYWAGDRDANQVADCMATEDATRKIENPLVSPAELDAIRTACPGLCGECAKKHFYYPASLMNEVRRHCPKACDSACSGTPFG
jgi:hypothetical protein